MRHGNQVVADLGFLHDAGAFEKALTLGGSGSLRRVLTDNQFANMLTAV